MEIKLGGIRGGIALVSKEDYDEVNKYKWWAESQGYIRGTVNGKLTFMHRFIMNPTKDEEVDHIFGNTFDNTRENLRNTSPAENKHNQQKRKNSSSGYFGVYIAEGKYRAHIKYNNEHHYLGTYDTEIEAAEIRDIYIIKKNLNHIHLNFPYKKEEYIKMDYIFDKPYKGTDFIGVYIMNSNFCAVISVNAKRIHIGSSPNDYDCAVMYDEYIVNNKIPDKKLNFPDKYDYFNKTVKTFYEILDKNTIKLLIKSVNCEQCVTIDLADYELIKYCSCFINGNGYVCVYKNGKLSLLHRLIMNVTDTNIFIDHVDSNVLNNTKINLRFSNAQKNAQNKSKCLTTQTSSQYIGVSYVKKRNQWFSSIKLNSTNVYKCLDITEEFGARRRDLFILDNLQDTHYKLNFGWTQEEMDKWKNKLNYKKIKTSNYAGIYYEEGRDMWKSKIKVDKKVVFYKCKKTEEELARLRDLFILDNLKDKNIKLNFEWTENEKKDWNKKLEPKQFNGPISKYDGIHYNNLKQRWMALLRSNNKVILCKQHINDTILARFRDIFILENLTNMKIKTSYKLNFEWTPSDIQEWKKTLNMSSQYLDVFYDKKEEKWCNNIILDKKEIHRYFDKSEEFTARERDLFLIHSSNKNFKLNFEWNDELIETWTNILSYKKSLQQLN